MTFSCLPQNHDTPQTRPPHTGPSPTTSSSSCSSSSSASTCSSSPWEASHLIYSRRTFNSPQSKKTFRSLNRSCNLPPPPPPPLPPPHPPSPPSLRLVFRLPTGSCMQKPPPPPPPRSTAALHLPKHAVVTTLLSCGRIENKQNLRRRASGCFDTVSETSVQAAPSTAF